MIIGPGDISIIIQGVALGLTALIARWSKRADTNAREAKEQVSNDHSSNLRNDIDEIKASSNEAVSLSREAATLSRAAMNKVDSVAADVVDLHRKIDGQTESIDIIRES